LEEIDWTRVGKPYKEDDPLESVLEREMNRLKLAMDQRIQVQDVELEEKVMAAKTGGKKK